MLPERSGIRVRCTAGKEEERVHSLPVSILTLYLLQLFAPLLVYFLFHARSDIVEYSAPRGRHGQVAAACVPERTQHNKRECAAETDYVSRKKMKDQLRRTKCCIYWHKRHWWETNWWFGSILLCQAVEQQAAPKYRTAEVFGTRRFFQCKGPVCGIILDF